MASRSSAIMNKESRLNLLQRRLVSEQKVEIANSILKGLSTTQLINSISNEKQVTIDMGEVTFIWFANVVSDYFTYCLKQSIRQRMISHETKGKLVMTLVL